MSTEQTKAPRKSSITASSRRNEALTRRLSGGARTVFGGGSKQIPLREPERWHTRVVNGELHPSRLYEMKHEKGWEPMEVADLPEGITPESIGFQLGADGRSLVRGAKGQEVIFKIDKEDFKLIEEAKTRANNVAIGSSAKTKDAIANAAASQFGGEAGDYVHKHIHGTVTDTRGPLSQA